MRAYHHGDLKRALLDTGVALLKQDGPAALAAREAARELDVSVTALYRHFESVEQWRADVSREAREALARHMLAAMAAVPAGPDAAEHRFRASGSGYIDFAIREPHLFAGAFMECGSESSQADDPSAADVLNRALDDLVTSGAMDIARRPMAFTIAWTAVHGLSALIVQGALEIASIHDAQVVAVLDGVSLALGIEPVR